MATRLLSALLLIALSSSSPDAAREAKAGREFALVGTQMVAVYTYRPSPCPNPKLLIVFAGYNRDADRYRDRARGLADRACLLVVAPLLDREQFPTWRYQTAGVTRKGRVQPQSKWTGPLLVELIAWGRKWTGRPDIPYILFGHSAGAQLLSRVSAYTPPLDAARIVIANPSAHVWPSLEEAAPYGFDGVFDAPTREARLRAYLALPITIYLGADDTGTKLLVDDEPAVRQGANRYERGRNVYRAASDLSRKRSWRFGWRLVEVPDTGHSASRMLDAVEAVEAIGLRAREPAQR